MDWIKFCEERVSDQLDRISEARSSQRTHSSRRSQKSRSSGRAQERTKAAELLAEKSMLKKKLELEVAEKEFEHDLQIAKVQANERAFSEMEEEEKRKALSDRQTEFLSLPEPKSSPADRRPSLLRAGNTGGLPHVKTERETRQVSSPFLNPTSEPYYRAFPGEMKTEIKRETPIAEKNRRTYERSFQTSTRANPKFCLVATATSYRSYPPSA